MPQPDTTAHLPEPVRERVVGTDFLAMVCNPGKLGFGPKEKRLVDLACGHKTLTSSFKTAICPRCTEMLRRSIATGEEDYDAFRRLGAHDRMVWPADPCRALHEPTDLAGRLING